MILYSVLDNQKTLKNTFLFHFIKNVRTFQALAQKFKDFSRKNGIQGLPLKFKHFSRLYEPGLQI